PPASSACIVSELPNLVHGINDRGDMVGRCFDADENEHGWVRWRDGTFEVIDYPGSGISGTSSDAYVITNTGKVIAGDYSVTEFVHGFTWTRSEGFRTVDFPGAVHSGIRAVTENGSVAGTYTLDINPFGPSHGFLVPNVTVDYPGSMSTGVGGMNNTSRATSMWWIRPRHQPASSVPSAAKSSKKRGSRH
ncbi:MAG: hypothetical protein DMG88_24185, partial [Acidobacteria bacterium]